MPIEIVQDVAKRCQAGQLKPWEQKMKDDRGLDCNQLGEAVASIVEAKIQKSSQSEIPLSVYNSLTEQDFKEYELPATKELKAIEVCAVGFWKGDHYTHEDLEELVKNWQELCEKNKVFEARFTLDHGKKNISGLPAIGYITKLWKNGEKLFADIDNIPNKIFEFVKAGIYKSISPEIWFNRVFNGKRYRRVMTAISLLGDKLPAMETLKDIENIFYKKDYSLPGEGGEARIYTSEDYKPENNIEYLNLEEIESICPDCAEKFKAAGMEQINYTDFKKWLKGNRPTRASIQSQLNALKALVSNGKIGKLKENQLADPAAMWAGLGGSFTSCVSTLEGKAGITDANALCAWLHHEVEGVWPAETSKQTKSNKEDSTMTEEQKKEMEDLKAKNAEMEKSLEEKSQETESFKAELSKKDEEGRKEKRDTWIEKYSTGDNPKIAPVEKPIVSYLMEQLDNGDGEVKKLSLDKEELTPVQAFQKLFEKRAGLSGIFRELSTSDATKRGEGPLSLDEEIQLYVKENSGKTKDDAVNYLMESKPALFKEYARKE